MLQLTDQTLLWLLWVIEAILDVGSQQTTVPLQSEITAQVIFRHPTAPYPWILGKVAELGTTEQVGALIKINNQLDPANPRFKVGNQRTNIIGNDIGSILRATASNYQFCISKNPGGDCAIEDIYNETRNLLLNDLELVSANGAVGGYRSRRVTCAPCTNPVPLP